MNIQFIVDADNLEDLRQKVQWAADMVKSWEGTPEQTYALKLTFHGMEDLLQDYVVELKKDPTPIIQRVANEIELKHAPVDTWPEIARIITEELALKREDEQFDDLLKELAW